MEGRLWNDFDKPKSLELESVNGNFERWTDTLGYQYANQSPDCSFEGFAKTDKGWFGKVCYEFEVTKCQIRKAYSDIKFKERMNVVKELRKR